MYIGSVFHIYRGITYTEQIPDICLCVYLGGVDMHIAVCDDNVADRKQLERLLKRESDKRAASTGIIYTDSFGNSTALLSNPMQYDAFYIDMCLTEGTTGTDVVNALTAQGVNAPIILCCSKINYREQTYPENVIFLDKPIKVAELAQSIDHALEIMAKAVPLIELREDEDTIYVTEPDILYAEEEGRNVIVTLKDGRTVKVATTAINLFSQIENHPTFFAPTVRAILNGRYMEKLGFRKVIMCDGKKFSLHRDCVAYAKQLLAEYHA